MTLSYECANKIFLNLIFLLINCDFNIGKIIFSQQPGGTVELIMTSVLTFILDAISLIVFLKGSRSNVFLFFFF